jgi:arylsulfatase A-like enzyme
MCRVKRILAALAALVLAASLASCSTTGPQTGVDGSAKRDPRPNFVFVLTDDLASNLIAHMPHVRQLQQQGRTMSNNYVVDSLCCPSRSAIFTGQYPHDNGVFTNAGTDGGVEGFNNNGDQLRTFAVRMQNAGYRTALMGKYLNGYLPTDPVPPGWSDWAVSGAGGYREFGYQLNEIGRVTRYGNAPKDYMVDVLSHKGAGFIASSAKAGKPFLLEMSTFAPHAPYVPAPRYVGTRASVPYPRTAAYDRLPKNPPSWLKGHDPLRPDEKALVARDWQLRLESVRAVDDMIGALQRQLKASGVERNTYVIFSSDNGLHMGEYRLAPGKETAYDTDVHVPLVVKGPGVPAGSTSSAMVSNIDLAPTFETLSRAGVDPLVDGVDLSAVWKGDPPADWQPSVLIEHHHRQGVTLGPDRQNARSADPPGYEAVRTAAALYVRYDSGEEEYYDLVADPDELDNLGARGVPDRMRRLLDALVSCHGTISCQTAAHRT